MSYKYETIQNEIYNKMRVDGHFKEDYVMVTPLILSLNFPLDKKRFIRPCCLSNKFVRLDKKIKNFEVRPDDVWVISYPKSGTTWTQEMVWLLKNDLNFEKAQDIPMGDRFPFLEIEGIRDLPSTRQPFEVANKMASPRFIKTHLPIQLLPDQIWTVKPKIIYIKRNVKDVAVSYFHHTSALHGYLGELKEFVEAFIMEFQLFSPYHDHISGYLDISEINSNILILQYEDLKTNLLKEIFKTADFLKVKVDDDKINDLCTHLSFQSMKNNKSVNMEDWVKYNLATTNRTNENDDNLQKGLVDGWKEELTLELSNKIEAWSNMKSNNT